MLPNAERRLSPGVSPQPAKAGDPLRPSSGTNVGRHYGATEGAFLFRDPPISPNNLTGPGPAETGDGSFGEDTTMLDDHDDHTGKVLVHFPSEETGIIDHDGWCTPEQAKEYEEGRAHMAKLRKQSEARRRRASKRYAVKPTERRRKALLDAILRITSLCSSHVRADKLVMAALWEPAEIWWPAFFGDWTACDAGSWRWKNILLDKFRSLRDAGQSAIPYLNADDREFYDSLPELIEVWRGADRRTLRNFPWTTDPAVAEFFAVHRRGWPFPNPVIGRAFIKKSDVFAAINGKDGRGEQEIILDPRRLRKLTIEDVSHIECGKARLARKLAEAA
jgi:hypothetical protein